MTPADVAKLVETAQQAAARDYTYGGILFLVLASSFYFVRLFGLKFFEQQAKRDENFRTWAEGHVTAIANGAGKISDAIESIENTAVSVAHEHITIQSNAERDRRDSERRHHDELMQAQRRNHDELVAVVKDRK